MSQPHEILGIPADAPDEAIRRAYLDKVRQHPPERDPDRFAEIRQAYDALRDPVARTRSLLFTEPQSGNLQTIVDQVRKQPYRLSADALLGLGN